MKALVVLLCAWSVVGEAQECTSDSLSVHSSTTVLYGPPGDTSQATVITPAADGSVHAVDAATGELLWSFHPPEAVGRSGDLITGIRLLRFDANGDGTLDISSGDKVWLYFGLRQAGPWYYALDITDRGKPRVLWKLGADALDGLADAWSAPTLARVRIAGATQNGEHFVLVFGGGYASAPASDADATLSGNRIFMVDAATGRLLWLAGADDGARTPDLLLSAMTDPVPARVAVIDTDGDEFADRMYAADVRGRVWRLDIWNGHTRDTLVTGGVLADLSGEGRVFFNAPDVALIQPRGGEAYYNLALGSGEPRIGAAGPARDFFYSVRDKAPFTRRSQTAYDGAAPILAADLFDLTTSAEGARIAPEAAGWKIAVGTAGSVLGESLTVSGVVLFTTFQPSPGADACAVGGSSRVYALRVDTAVPGLDFDDDGEITAADLSKPLPITGLPGEIRIETGEPSAEWAGGGDASRGDGASGAGENTTANSSVARCLVGSYVLSSCVPLRTLVRTYWQRPSVN